MWHGRETSDLTVRDQKTKFLMRMMTMVVVRACVNSVLQGVIVVVT
jgi:hypothetical protein